MRALRVLWIVIAAGCARRETAPAITTEASATPVVASAPVIAAASSSPVAKVYATWKSIALRRAADGFDGTLRLLEDARVTAPGANRDARIYGDDGELLNARLELLDAGGNVVATRETNRPIADLEARDLRGDGRPTYLFTVDYSCGMGSYCGPEVDFLEPTPTALDTVLVDDVTAHRRAKLSVMTSLKTGWDVAPARTGRGHDVRAVICRPFTPKGAREPTFLTVYERFSFVDGHWTKRWKQVKAFTEMLGDELPFVEP